MMMRKNAFTLLELLIALGIFSIVAIAVSSTFGAGINAWRKMDGALDRYQEMRLVLDRIGWELRNAVDMDIDKFDDTEDSVKADFYGEKDKIIFFTVKHDGIKRVAYQTKVDKDSPVGNSSYFFERTEENFTTKPFEDNSKGELIMNLIKNIEFRYLNKVNKWQESWMGEDAKTLPLQIRMKLIFYVPTGRKNEFQEISIDKYVEIISAKKI